MNSHVVLDAIRQTMRCNHCRSEQPLPTPCPLTDMIDSLNVFEASHQHCPRSEEGFESLRVRTAPNGAALVRDASGLWWTWTPTGKHATYTVSALTRQDALEGLRGLAARLSNSRDLDDQASVRQAQLALASEGVKP